MAKRRSRVRAALKKLAGANQSGGKDLAEESSSVSATLIPEPNEKVGRSQASKTELIEEIELIEEEKPVEEIELIEEEKPVEEIELIEEEKPVEEIELIEEEKPVEEIELIEEEKPVEEVSSNKKNKKRRRRKSSGAGGSDSSEIALFAFIGVGALILIGVVIAMSGSGSRTPEEEQIFRNSLGQIITREEFEAIEIRNRDLRDAAKAREAEKRAAVKKSPPTSRATPITYESDRETATTETNDEPSVAENTPQTDGPLPGWMRGNFTSDEISITSTPSTPVVQEREEPPTTTSTTSTPPPPEREATPTRTDTTTQTQPNAPFDLRTAEGWP